MTQIRGDSGTAAQGRAQRQVSSRRVGTSPALRLVGLRLAALTVLAGLAGPAVGQPANRPAPPDDPMSRPTEHGLRFTPTMARAIGRLTVTHAFKGQYGLPDERADEATEAIARRLMEMAHTAEEPGQALAEFTVEAFSREMAKSGGGGLNAIPRTLGMGVGQRILPMMPAIRELVRGVGQDLRPMLPAAQQLKLARDLMAAKAGLDILEESMKKWAAGDVDPHGNPFEQRGDKIETDESGESKALKAARERAQQEVEGKWRSKWEEYVAQAKKFYGFDDAQSATADSILREMIERAATIQADTSWRERVYGNELWAAMAGDLGTGQGGLLRVLIAEDQSEALRSLSDLGQELKGRIDRIPTQAQRDAAEQRVIAALAEQGFGVTDLEKTP